MSLLSYGLHLKYFQFASITNRQETQGASHQRRCIGWGEHNGGVRTSWWVILLFVPLCFLSNGFSISSFSFLVTMMVQLFLVTVRFDTSIYPPIQVCMTTTDRQCANMLDGTNRFGLIYRKCNCTSNPKWWIKVLSDWENANKLWTCTSLKGRQLGIERMSHSTINLFYKEYRYIIKVLLKPSLAKAQGSPLIVEKDHSHSR